MFPVDRTSLFGSIYAQLELLVGPSWGGLSSQDVASVLRASALLTRLSGQAEQLSIEIENQLGGRVASMGAAEHLRALQEQLSQVITICKGDMPGSSLEDLERSARTWADAFLAFLEKLRHAEQEHHERVAFEESLRRADDLMKNDCFLPWQSRWTTNRAAALRILEEGLDVKLAAAVLEDCSDELGIDFEDGVQLAAHYPRAPTWPQCAAAKGVAGIVTTCEAIVDWSEHAATHLNQAPEDLPPSPTGAEAWCVGPLAYIAFHIEYKLAPGRAARDGATPVLAALAQLGTSARANSTAPLPCTTAQYAILVNLLGTAAVEGSFLEALANVASIVGAADSTTLEMAAEAIQNVGRRNALWRLETVDSPFASAGRQILGTVRRHYSVMQNVPLPLLLHLTALPVANDGDAGEAGAWLRLLELGSFGAWLLAARWERGGAFVGEELLRAHLTQDDEIRPEIALPFALLPRPPAEGGLLSLLAAMEILASRRGIRPSFQHAGLLIQRERSHYPRLTSRLDRLMAGQASGASSINGVTADEPEKHLEEQVRTAVRPRNYKGVRALEAVSREFAAQVAIPLFLRAQDATRNDEFGQLLKQVRQERSELVEGVDRRGEKFLHPPEGRLRKSLLCHCDEMLEALERYVSARKNSSATLRATGGTELRESLIVELEQLSHSGWAGREAARLFQLLLVDDRPPSVELPGDRPTGASKWLWCFPRCAGLWQDGELSLGRYATELQADLVGTSPVGFALEQAENGRLGRAEEILQNLPVPTSTADLSQLEESRNEWRDFVAQWRRDLDSLVVDVPLTEDETDKVALGDEALKAGGFDEAMEIISAIVTAVEQRRKELARAVDPVYLRECLNALEREAQSRSATDRSAIRHQLVDLDAQLDSEPREVAARLPVMYDRLSLTCPPELVSFLARKSEFAEGFVKGPDAPTAAIDPAATDPVATDPMAADPAATAATSWYGIVKKVAGQGFGFITPLIANDPAISAVHFRWTCVRDLCDGHLDDLLGVPVEFEPGPPLTVGDQPSARWVRVCTAGQRAEMVAKLVHRFGPHPVGVGVLIQSRGRCLVLTGTGDAYATIPMQRVKPGMLVEFDGPDPNANTVQLRGLADKLNVPSTWMTVLTRLAERLGTQDMAVLAAVAPIGSILAQAFPSSPNAVGRLRELVDLNDIAPERHEEIERAVAAMEAQGHASATWLGAMTVFSRLVVARKRGSKPREISEILDALRNDAPRWWHATNFDAAASWLSKSLAEFARKFPDDLTLEDIRGFFETLQKDRGANPHFRLEMILARLSEQLYEDTEDAAHLQAAQARVDRARVLNPRLLEAVSFDAQLKRRQREGFDLLREPIVGGPHRPADPLPEDPFQAASRVREFYQTKAQGAGGLALARDYFARHWETARGLVRGLLVTEHGRCLLEADEAVEAERLALRHALEDHVPDWEPLLRLLDDTWARLRMPRQRIFERLDQLRPRVPPGQQHLALLLLARRAFNEQDFAAVLEFAYEAEKLTPTPEGGQFIRRAEARLGRIALPIDARRRLAVDRVHRVVAENPENAVVELVLDCLTDVDVGPWLVHELIVGNIANITLSPLQRKNLITFAQSQVGKPSLDLLLAEAAVRWGDEPGYRQEGGLETIPVDERGPLRDAVEDPRKSENLEGAFELLTNRPWSNFAFFDCLWQQQTSDLLLNWYRAEAARRVLRSTEYVDSCMVCLGQLARASHGEICNRLFQLERYGFALAVARMAPQQTRALFDLAKMAQQRCTIKPWEWPRYLQSAKVAENWSDAAEFAIRTLLAAPTHWPACRAFFDVFSQRADNDPRGAKDLDLALKVVDYVRAQPRLGDEPELLVLAAELEFERALLQRGQKVAEETRQACEGLCLRAQQFRPGFRPALELHQRLKAHQQETLRYGEIYHGYKVGDIIGSGAYGQIFKATPLPEHHPDKVAPVALKNVLTVGATAEKRETRRKAVERGARIGQRLHHPHIVRTLDFLDDKCLVMEYIDGKTTDEFLPGIGQRRLTWREVAMIGQQVASAMLYATETVLREEGAGSGELGGFAHRDLHHKNLMLVESSNGLEAKILDFDLARVPASVASTANFDVVEARHKFRAPGYGRRSDLRDDMFALGVILYDLLCADGPYPSREYHAYLCNQSTPEEARLLVPRPVRTLPESPPDVPDGLEKILLCMVAFRTADRYTSWQSLFDEFAQLLPAEGRS